MAFSGQGYYESATEDDEEHGEETVEGKKPPPQWDDDLERDSGKYFNERAPPMERTNKSWLEKGHLPKLVSKIKLVFR